MSSNDPRIELFCKISRNGVPCDIYPQRIYDALIKSTYQDGKIKIVNNTPFLYDDGFFHEDQDGKKVMANIKTLIPDDLVEPARIKRVFDLFRMSDALSVDFSQMNQQPDSMVCFRNGMLDLRTLELKPHDSKYLCVNQIPYDYDPNDLDDYKDSVADRFFHGLIPDYFDRRMFYRFVGLCFSRYTKLQKFLVLVGLPGSGKSEALTFIRDCLGGDQNVSTVSIQNLSQRFYPSLLLGKLVNIFADISRTAIEDTSIVKSLVGEDVILAERKGQDGFPFRPYARLIFSANELPVITDEKSSAFFRRILAIEIKEMPPYIENLREGLQKNRGAFIAKCMHEAHEFFAAGEPEIDSVNSKEIVNRFYTESDSVMAFLEQDDDWNSGKRISRIGLYNAYRVYCADQGIRELNKPGFFKNLRGKTEVHETKYQGQMCFQKCPKPAPKVVNFAPNCDEDPSNIFV